MQAFRDLGERVLARWKGFDFDPDAFPDVAVRELEADPPSRRVTTLDVVLHTLRASDLPRQPNLDSTFGQPPITVYASERFYIQVLFWTDGTTSIHQHAFSGAFHVLEGSSIHSTFMFERSRRYCLELMVGQLKLSDVEVLRQGATRPIASGARLIHSLFHCERPSVTVVIRTYSQPADEPQYVYARSGVAYDPFFQSALGTRKGQVLDLLRETDCAEFSAIAAETVASSDSFLAFQLIQHLSKALPQTTLEVLLEAMGTAHGDLLPVLRALLSEREREQYIVTLRRGVVEPELRFFLAILLNVVDRARLIGILGSAFRERDPLDVFEDMLVRVGKLDSIHEWASSQFEHNARSSREEVPLPLDRRAARIARLMLEGRTQAEIVEVLGRRGTDSNHIAAQCLNTCRSPLLNALLK